MPRNEDDTVHFENISIGADSDSGNAVMVKFEDEWIWIPYSQITKLFRNPRVQGSDSIDIQRWLVEKRGLA